MSIMDSLIAATALHHKMTLATRNLSDFEHAGVSLFNPWE
jgi:predicted nucleic acid-binding protein